MGGPHGGTRAGAAPLVALTGAGGFIGSAVLRRLTGAAAPQPARVRALVRRPVRLPPGVEELRADLADPPSVAGFCTGADVLVHAASYVGPDVRRCRLVNDEGTAALMREAARAGVARIVQLSTTAVYGRGPHRGAAVGDLAPAPGSPTSASRLAGEGHALAAGGLVLRTNLITGSGDRWVVPALAELLGRAPGHWDGGHARLSLVDVTDLARLTACAALRPGAPPRGVRHAVHPEPVRTRALLERLAALGVLPAVREELDWPRTLRLLRARPGAVTERQLELLARDHWYDCGPVWEECGCPPGPGPLARLADAAPWYRDRVGRAAPP